MATQFEAPRNRSDELPKLYQVITALDNDGAFEDLVTELGRLETIVLGEHETHYSDYVALLGTIDKKSQGNPPAFIKERRPLWEFLADGVVKAHEAELENDAEDANSFLQRYRRIGKQLIAVTDLVYVPEHVVTHIEVAPNDGAPVFGSHIQVPMARLKAYSLLTPVSDSVREQIVCFTDVLPDDAVEYLRDEHGIGMEGEPDVR